MEKIELEVGDVVQKMIIETREQYGVAVLILSLMIDKPFWEGDKYDEFFESFVNAIEQYEQKFIRENTE